MAERRLLDQALAEMAKNPQQLAAVGERGHCVVLAGPGSGKTKTLTVAMARALLEDVIEPRGIACITYNNECAIELETRLAKLGIEPSERIFIGTVHSFALTQVIYPYARCALPELKADFRLATEAERKDVVETAYRRAINQGENPQERWRFAADKRLRQVDRTRPEWKGRNPQLAAFVEAYEKELYGRGLIHFDDMPLLAVRMLGEHEWIRQALHAKFPVLFVDEYQDLGHPLHELVLLLCFRAGTRLFAVADPDQSIYVFTGANPELIDGLAKREGVRPIRLKFNYRSGKNIVEASKAALGEDRGYAAPDDADDGDLYFHPVNGTLAHHASFLVDTLIPKIQARGIPLEEIGVLYRAAWQGNEVAEAVSRAGIPFVRADAEALVKRSSRLSRFIEACARWATGGWKSSDPPFRRLLSEAVAMVYGGNASREERREIEGELIAFLHGSIDAGYETHDWLVAFNREVLRSWRKRARVVSEDWGAIDQMIERTDPTRGGKDMPLAHLGGLIEGHGRLNLSTFHSAKGREFDSVILFGMNDGILPADRDRQRVEQLREARRLFYVGVTRPRKELHLTFTKGSHSPWVKELYERTQK